MHGLFRSVLEQAAADPHAAEILRQAAVDADGSLVKEPFQFRNIGIPLNHHWSTQHNGADFGADYLSRAAMGKANIFVNTPAKPPTSTRTSTKPASA